VRVEGQEGEQVYIQIGDQMEMLTQQQARQVCHIVLVSLHRQVHQVELNLSP